MPDVYGPFTGQTWTQGQWFRDAYAREGSSRVYGTSFASTGVGDLALTTSGLTVTLALGRAHVRGAGYERTGTAWSTTLATNTNANPRIDRIVLRRDLTAGTVVPTVIQGTPAATPTVPAATQVEDGVWDLPLFNVQVPGGSGTTLTNITDERPGTQITDITATGPIQASSGWTLNNVFVRLGPMGTAYVSLLVTRSGTAITVPADGNIANTQVAQIAAAWSPIDSIPMLSTSTGPLAVGTLTSAGAINLYAIAPGATLATGTQLGLTTGSFYPLAAPLA
jgi:hypothetical protein